MSASPNGKENDFDADSEVPGMATETGPITQLLRRGFFDPATVKLLSIGVTIYLLSISIGNIGNERHIIPCFIILGSSLFYSIFTLFIEIFKNCDFFKQRFGNVNIHEFQSTMAMTLALSNLSGFFFVGNAYRGFLMAVLTLSLVLLHLIDWYLNYQLIPKSSDNETEKPIHCIFTKFVADLCKKCSVFFNHIQMACFIGAIICITKSKSFSPNAGYFFYCAGFSVVCLLLLTLSQVLNKRFSKNDCKHLHAGQKYLLIAVSVHSFLALLFFSLLFSRFTVTEQKWIFNDEENTWKTSLDHTFNGPIIVTTDDPLNSTRPHYLQTIYTTKIINAPLAIPTTFILSVIAFILSIIRIQPATMPLKMNLYDNGASEEITTDSDQKFNNLPTVIEFLQNSEEIKKPPLF